MYSIVDIETTGGNHNQGKITEVAIYNFDGFEITDSYSTLVNPERTIPYFIRQLTGITDEMVSDAPTFPEVAAKIVEMTEGNIFVAHNVSFDYRFLKTEFKSLGYDFIRKTLCTVQLSKRILPGRKSYSLGKLCRDIGIELDNHHRASADAKATTELFNLLIQNDSKKFIEQSLKKSSINRYIHKELVESLPNETGVYYFYNSLDELIYVGKSVNIRKRVMSHFSNSRGRKAQDMKNAITRIDYEVTGNELVALLREAMEIKKNNPLFNAALRRNPLSYGLFAYRDTNGYDRLEVRRLNKKNTDEPLLRFGTKTEGRRLIERLCERFNLCEKLCGLHKAERHCPGYLVNMCEGACLQDESPESYNARFEESLSGFQFEDHNFLIVEEVYSRDNVYIIQVENGSFRGLGTVEKDCFKPDPEYLIDFVNDCMEHPDMNHIVRSFVKRNQVSNIIAY